jgi:succinate dehydrogenase hydrophobic anchor subunit
MGRIFGLAVVDIVGTFVIAILIARFMKKKTWVIFLFLVLLAEIIHFLLGIKTPITSSSFLV